MQKIINVYIDKTGDVFAAKDYETAVKICFNKNWISINDEILIDNEYTTLKNYFGEEVYDIMSKTWEIDDFNEFWEGDLLMDEVEYFD